MSTELAIYDRIANPIEATKSFGLSIHQSGIFGTKAACQGEVLAMECFARGVPPLTLAENYHLVMGKLSKKADAILDDFERLGGKSQLIERTPERAAIKLEYRGNAYEFSLSWEEAQQEPFVYDAKESEALAQLAAGKKPAIKAKYSTPRSRTQMLWARVVSDSIRAICPAACRGVYTPEEVSDFDEVYESNGHATETTAKKVANGRAVKKPTASAATTATTENVSADGDVIDVPFEEVKEAAATVTTTEINAATGEPAYCTAEQSNRLKELWGLLEVSVEDRNKQLAKRNATVARNLTVDQASELIGKLETVWVGKQIASETAPAELVQLAREKLKQTEQMLPGTVKKVTAKVNAAGYKSLTELSRGDVESLINALTGNQTEQFFMADLWPVTKPAKK